MKLSKQVLTLLLCFLLVQFTAQADWYGPMNQSNEKSPTPPAQPSAQELQQLVAPIALYPDALVAQILAASTYPTQIVEADRWMQSHSDLKGEKLAQEVDKQHWDPSVKALAQFPSVLENMDKNLSWTSTLGDAYANEPQDVTDAVQTMRQQAHKAGNLNSNEQEKVTTQDNTIIVEPANPDVVYVPAYDPWLVYGAPIVAYPGWYSVPGIFGAASGSRSVLDLALATSEDLVGAGATGDTTGMAVAQSMTITPSSRTVEPLIAADSITLTSAAGALATQTRSMRADLAVEVRSSTDLQRLTFSQELAPVRSAALITAEMREDFPPEDDQALEVAPTEAFMAVVGDISRSPICTCGICRESKNGGEHHAAVDFNFCST